MANAITTAAIILVLITAAPVGAQSTATLHGRVSDASGSAFPGATVRVHNASTGFDRVAATDGEGRYHILGIQPGSYHISATAPGFRTTIIEELVFEIGRTVVRDFRLEIGGTREEVFVRAEPPLIEAASSSVAHAVPPSTVQDAPLNGRRFIDLALLVPGSVAPSQTGFSTTSIRGLGSLAINTAGSREEAVAFLVNGVSTNNLTFGSLIFQPPIASIQEFRVENSAFGAQHGHVSGAIVSMVTRSGTDTFRGELFEFFRDDALDARNFFEFTSSDPHPFNRTQFGGSLGGPFVRGRTFFLGTYEGMRQRQGLDMNSLVLSDEQRASVTNPVVSRLVEHIPRANHVDAGGNRRFVGSAEALVESDRWTIDVHHNVSTAGSFHAFYGAQRLYAIEPASQGTTIPGFGHVNHSDGSIFTVAETHVLGPALFNEIRFGRSTLDGRIDPRAGINPESVGIRNGVERPIGLPQMLVAGGLNFGGPAPYPQGRIDASYILADHLQFVRGRHSLKVGGEYRRFLNENFAEGTGLFNFPTVAAFLDGVANAFSITLGERRNHISQQAVSSYIHDSFALRSNLTLDLGLRYEWHVTPTERDNHFVVFDSGSASLLRVGTHLDEIYRQNNRNFEPRAGVAWDLGGIGQTVLRGAYAWTVDQPSTTAVRDTAANPPFASPVTAAGAIALGDALATTRPIGLAPATVDPAFRNASLQSWNANLQRQLASSVAVSAGYYGSRGLNLRISRNLNQPANGIRPFAALSAASPILPGTPLGNIIQVESSGFSSYNALWLSATSRRSRGLQLEASYTLSKSLDTNSLNSSGFAVQDSYDIPNQYGLSDFNARHRFLVSAIYELPFARYAWTRGWQLAAIVQSQSGNPVNIVTSNSTLNGVPNTIRPDLVGPIHIIGSVDQWFDTSAFMAVDRFGNLGRNVVIGPAYHNTDLSLIKNTALPRNMHLQCRVDVFDLWNHPNFGPPGNIAGSPTFGRITRTRFATGEGGSSRQLQLAAKLSF
jgi:Carboxypeptidase regulatory-like domain